MTGTILILALAASASFAPCQRPEPGASPTHILARALAATRMGESDGRVLHMRSQLVRELRDLSDRTTPPFDASITEEDIWFDPRSGMERIRLGGPSSPSLWNAAHVTLIGTDSVRPAPLSLHGFARWQRGFDAWAVLTDWAEGGDAVMEGRCVYLGYRVQALKRPDGSRLFVNETDGLPVALVRAERSYFRGREMVEYRYFNWEHVGKATLPLSAMRIIDGKRDRLRTLRVGPDGTALVARDSAPTFPLVGGFAAMPDTLLVAPEPFWSTDSPDTVRVSAFLPARRRDVHICDRTRR